MEVALTPRTDRFRSVVTDSCHNCHNCDSCDILFSVRIWRVTTTLRCSSQATSSITLKPTQLPQPLRSWVTSINALGRSKSHDRWVPAVKSSGSAAARPPRPNVPTSLSSCYLCPGLGCPPCCLGSPPHPSWCTTHAPRVLCGLKEHA